MKNRILSKVANVFMITVLIIILIWLFGIYNDLFRTYVRMFFMLWLFIPILSLWLSSHFIQSKSSMNSLTTIRIFLITIALIISLSYLVHVFNYREMLYTSSHMEIVDWLEKIHFSGYEWLFQLIIIVLCFLIPSLTWLLSSKAIEKFRKGIVSN